MVFLMPSSGTSSSCCNGSELTVLYWDLHIHQHGYTWGFSESIEWLMPSHPSTTLVVSTCHSCLISLYWIACLQTSQSETNPPAPAGSSHMSSSVWYPPSPNQSCPLAYWGVWCSIFPCSTFPHHPSEQKSSHIWYVCMPQATAPKSTCVQALRETRHQLSHQLDHFTHPPVFFW